MIKEALEYIINQSKPQIETINGRKYSNKQLLEIQEPMQNPICLQTITGMVDYLNNDPDGIYVDGKTIINISTPDLIEVFSPVDIDYRRHRYLKTSADLPCITLGQYISQESFIIQLQTCFSRIGDWDKVIQIASNVKLEEGVQMTDDGTSQAVTAKTGVARVATIELPNPVMLAPIRSFHEIEQPLVPFVYRIDQGGRIGLFEADGGAWRREAVMRIKNYISRNLQNVDDTTILA